MVEDNSPATELFPQFQSRLYDMISAEVQGLNDPQLDFESDCWEWSKWSIRRNVSHLAAGDYRWLWMRWGPQLFPGGLPNGPELDRLLESPYDRRLDETLYWQLPDVLAKVREALGFCWSVLSAETVGSLRAKELETPSAVIWVEHSEMFSGGVRVDGADSSKAYITLEATMSHRYYEYLAHLYNMQRLKKAQGLEPVVEVPFEGYWAQPSWDRSEP